MNKTIAILILEDNPSDAGLMEYELREAGITFTAKRVMTGDAFVRGIETFHPDLILSDYNLPNYSGIEALTEAKSRCPETPFVLVTGALGEDRAIEVMTQGANDYVLKDRLERLAPAVRRVLAEAEERKARRMAEEELREAYRTLESKIAERTAELQAEIAERTQAEAAIRKSETRFRSLFEVTQDAILIFDQESGSIIEANPAASRLYGYSRDELLRMRHVDISAEPEEMSAAFRDITTTIPLRMQRKKDETVFPVEITRGYFEEENRHLHTALIRDISIRTRVEEALRESEEKYRLVVENAREGIVIAQDGVFQFANQAAADIVGYPKEILLSRPFAEFIHPDDRAKVTGYYDRRFRGWEAPQVYTSRVLKSDGTVRWVEANVVLIPWKGRPAALNILSDITERRAAEEALRESEERLRLASQSARIGTYTYDFTAGRGDWSAELKALYGLRSDQDLVLDADHVPVRLHPEDRSAFLTAMEEAKKPFGNTDGLLELDYRIMHTDGSVRCLHVHGRTEFAGEGEMRRPLRAAGAVVDVTERKAQEIERRTLEERLQRAEKMEALGTLAGGIAHDLNNVLGVLVGYSELVLYDVGATGPVRSHVEEIVKSGERAAAIVQDMLALARRGVQTRNVVNLNTIIMDCQKSPEFLNLLSFHPHIRIETNLEADLLNMMGSPVHLGKTIMNLLSNAAEAMPKGGLLAIGTDNRYMDRPVHGYDDVKEGDYVVLSVSDTGDGIPARDIKRIFEPFYTKKIMGRSGTGLGLAVVWGTVKDHHGYIDIRSEVGRGTTFTLYFPVTRETMAKDQAAVPLSAYTGHDEAILVVDDVAGQRELATEMLSRLKYRVHAVSSGEEAVEYLARGKADLVVLDMIMDPGIDGLETYERILELNPSQKAVIVSGFSETDRVKRAQELGAGAYVRKPYVMETLGLAVRKELDRQRD